MHVTPLQDWVVVRLEPLPKTTASGLVLPEGTSGMNRQQMGTVLRVGPGKTNKRGQVEPVGVTPGDRVMFFRENLEHQQGKEVTRILQELEESTGMLRGQDILFAVEES